MLHVMCGVRAADFCAFGAGPSVVAVRTSRQYIIETKINVVGSRRIHSDRMHAYDVGWLAKLAFETLDVGLMLTK